MGSPSRSRHARATAPPRPLWISGFHLIWVLLGVFVGGAILTNVANLLVIVATAPLWAAIGAALFLREVTPLRTWLASIAPIAGIAFVVAPEWTAGFNIGDFIALLTAWSMAGAFVVSRATAANLALAPALGGLFSAIALFPFVQHLTFAHPSQIIFMIIEGGFVVPLALGLIASAPKYLPASRVGLFLLLERY